MTWMSPFTRSPQSLTPFGFPLRTRNTTVDVYGELLSGRRFCQSAAICAPLSWITSMSYASARVTTSAPRPSITERACALDPPCDCLIVTSCPLCCFQCVTNAALKSLYSSRVGSYETLSNSTEPSEFPSQPPHVATISVSKASTVLRFMLLRGARQPLAAIAATLYRMKGRGGRRCVNNNGRRWSGGSVSSAMARYPYQFHLSK